MPDEVLTKACRQCGATHPLTSEFYGVQTASADGFVPSVASVFRTIAPRRRCVM